MHGQRRETLTELWALPLAGGKGFREQRRPGHHEEESTDVLRYTAQSNAKWEMLDQNCRGLFKVQVMTAYFMGDSSNFSGAFSKDTEGNPPSPDTTPCILVETEI